ncbi:MAG: hypothetical protein U1F34_01800 [Gammaproteobacteria bacterium]
MLVLGATIGAGAVHLAGGSAARLLHFPFLGVLLLAFASLAWCIVLIRRWLEPTAARETLALCLMAISTPDRVYPAAMSLIAQCYVSTSYWHAAT